MYGGFPLPLCVYYSVFGNTYSALQRAETSAGIAGLRRFAIVVDMVPDCIVPFARVCTIRLSVPDVSAFALLSVRHLDVLIVGEHLNMSNLRCETLTLRTSGWCAVTIAESLRSVHCINGGEFDDRSACAGDILISPKIVEFVHCPHLEHIKCTGYSVDTTQMCNPGLLSIFQRGPAWHSSIGDHRELRAIYIREPLTYVRFYKLQYAILHDDIRFVNTIGQAEQDADTRAWLDKYNTTCVRVPESMVDICATGPMYEYSCRILQYPPARELQIIDTAVEDTRILGEYLTLAGLYLTVLHRCSMDMCAPSLQNLSICCVGTARLRPFTICFPSLTDLTLSHCRATIQPMYLLAHVAYTDCTLRGAPWVKNTKTIDLCNTTIAGTEPCESPVAPRLTINGRNINKLVNICKKLVWCAQRNITALGRADNV